MRKSNYSRGGAVDARTISSCEVEIMSAQLTQDADCHSVVESHDRREVAADKLAHPAKWEFPGEEVVLTEPGANPNDGIRRPFEYAVLTEGPELGSFDLSAQVRIDEKASVNNRDLFLVFGWQSDTEYYYAHLSKDNTIYPHNGIFKVNNADRERIDQQWDGSVGAPPAITDEQWHDVCVIRCAAVHRERHHVRRGPGGLRLLRQLRSAA